MEKFLDFTIGNVVTILTMLLALAVMWQKLKDKVDTLEESVKKQAEVIEKMNTMGTPNDRASTMVFNSRLDGHASRLAAVEQAVQEFSGIRADVGWVKTFVQAWLNKEHKKE